MLQKIEYVDDVFDLLWSTEIAHKLVKAPWYPNNTANRKGWPYFEKGSHTFFGKLFFKKYNAYDIQYDPHDNELNFTLINAFGHILKYFQMNANLTTIDGNLQFKGMDGSTHVDGPDNQVVFILMLCSQDLPDKIGGEFIHLPSKKKIPFKHGRLIKMRASDPHYAKAFNKPNFSRISIKWTGDLI